MRIRDYSHPRDFKHIKARGKYTGPIKETLKNLYDGGFDALLVIAISSFISAYTFNGVVFVGLLIASISYLFFRSDKEAEYLLPGILFFSLVYIILLAIFYYTHDIKKETSLKRTYTIVGNDGYYYITKDIDNKMKVITDVSNKIKCSLGSTIYEYDIHSIGKYTDDDTLEYTCSKKDLK